MSSDLAFSCPHCGQHIECGSDMAGETLDCPACNNEISVPASTEATPIESPMLSPKEPLVSSQPMKQLTCEMCGSADLIKHEGVYQCQSCGTKYSIEEAKKMMIQGRVDVTGSTVKIDTSEKLDKLLKIARRAKDSENSENAAKYYELALLEDPSCWEASFYSVYFSAMNYTVGNIKSAAVSVSKSIDTTLGLIEENVPNPEDQQIAIAEVSARCKAISDMLFTASLKSYRDALEYGTESLDVLSDAKYEFIDRACASIDIMYIFGDHIVGTFGDNRNLCGLAAEAWKSGIENHSTVIRMSPDQNTTNAIRSVIMQYTEKVRQYDTSFQPPEETSACYIATAVYGSYDCPQLWTLRRYRDNTLAMSWYGRAFIRAYYVLSPRFVECFGDIRWLRKILKKELDKIVDGLQSKGVSCRPYEDNSS